MTRVIAVHDVADVGVWLQGKAERAAAIEGMGGSDVVDFVAQDGSPKVAVGCETADLAALLAGVSSPTAETLAAMERHGVIPPITLYVES